MKILFVYRYFTYGGVETVLRNRIKALKKLYPNIKIGTVFLYKYAELKDGFGDEVCFTKEPLEIKKIADNYDVISVLDTPEVFDILDSLKKEFILEVHTPYDEHRSYIKEALPNNIKLVVVPSNSFGKLVKREISNKSIPIKSIYNPLNYSFFQNFQNNEEKLKLNLQKFMPLLWIGRLDELKNWKRALKIFSKLINTNMELFIIGRSNEDSLEELTHIFKRYKLLKYIRYLRYITFGMMRELYDKASKNSGIYLSTSKGESFGMTVVEAMASGLPCVLNDLGVFREVTEGNALFFSNENEASEQIIKIKDNPEIRKKMKNEALDIVMSYHPENIAREIYKTFVQL